MLRQVLMTPCTSMWMYSTNEAGAWNRFTYTFAFLLSNGDFCRVAWFTANLLQNLYSDTIEKRRIVIHYWLKECLRYAWRRFKRKTPHIEKCLCVRARLHLLVCIYLWWASVICTLYTYIHTLLTCFFSIPSEIGPSCFDVHSFFFLIVCICIMYMIFIAIT